MKKMLLASLAAALLGSAAWATPSTQIWIPSTDIQKFKTLHLNIDTYIADADENSGTRKAPLSVIGPTVGILPFEKVQAEVGFDVMNSGSNSLDTHPMYVHGKVGTPEGSLAEYSPAVAAGMYNVGFKKDVTDQNIMYGLAAKTLPVVGRLSAGYYKGNDKLLVDENGSAKDNGLLLSWDRTITEISEKLWASVDYQGGNSALGALSFGASWAFSPNTSVILGYDIYNNQSIAGKNTVTMQVDINFP